MYAIKNDLLMEENKRENRDEIVKKILEIKRKEEELKQRKILLRQQRPWYTQASNIIGLLTIIITITIAVFSFIANEDKLDVLCTYSEPEPFTNISPTISNSIKVEFNGIPAKNIGRVKFMIENTGTRAVKKSDFVDGPIMFYLAKPGQQEVNDSINRLPFLLDVVKVRNANQRNDLIKIESANKDALFTYLPSLLNPGQTVEFDALVSDINNLEIDIKGSIADGNFRIVKQYENIEKSKFMVLGESIISLLGAKWIAITLLIILFLLSLLKTLGIIANGEWEHTPLEYIFGTLFFAIDFSFLAMIISVSLN